MRVYASNWLKNTRNAANSRHRASLDAFDACQDGLRVVVLQIERPGKEEPEILRVELDMESALSLMLDLKLLTRCG